MIYVTYFYKIRYFNSMIVPISISDKTPSWYKGIYCNELIPNKKIHYKYLVNKDLNEFSQHYLNQIENIDFSILINRLLINFSYRNIAFVSYKDDIVRKILCYYLNSININCEEFDENKYNKNNGG